jgi:hypothetical protein
MANSSLRGVYRIPLLLGFITIIGLLSALLGDGVWDGFSWLLLAIPLLLLGFIVRRPPTLDRFWKLPS